MRKRRIEMKLLHISILAAVPARYSAPRVPDSVTLGYCYYTTMQAADAACKTVITRRQYTRTRSLLNLPGGNPECDSG